MIAFCYDTSFLLMILGDEDSYTSLNTIVDLIDDLSKQNSDQQKLIAQHQATIQDLEQVLTTTICDERMGNK